MREIRDSTDGYAVCVPLMFLQLPTENRGNESFSKEICWALDEIPTRHSHLALFKHSHPSGKEAIKHLGIMFLNSIKYYNSWSLVFLAARDLVWSSTVRPGLQNPACHEDRIWMDGDTHYLCRWGRNPTVDLGPFSGYPVVIVFVLRLLFFASFVIKYLSLSL
jgi:hypothetical protein